MSGNTIGGIVGGAIGFWVGGPAGAQWGWMIGSAVGGIVDPQTIQGAQWQNQQLQGSSDGLGRAVIFGTATVTGNLLDAEPGGPRIGKKTEGGKGGPEVERDTAILTYAVEICDSSELRGTKVNGIIAVWEDEKLVYDARPDVETDDEGNDNIFIKAWKIAHNKKWDRNKKFYFGGEDQMPPPELEAIHGSGNVPAYRGSCIMVVHDEDLMVDLDDKPRGRIPTYRFLVSACEPVLPETPRFLIYGVQADGSRAVVTPYRFDITPILPANRDVFGENNTAVYGSVRFGADVYASDSASCVISEVSDLTIWQEGPSPAGFTASGGRLMPISGVLWQAAGDSGVRYAYDETAFTTIDTFSSTIIATLPTLKGVVAISSTGQIYRGGVGGFSLVADIYLPAGLSLQSAESSLERLIIVGNRYVPAIEYSDDAGETFSAASFPMYASNGQPRTIRYAGRATWFIGSTLSDDTPTGLFISTDNGESWTEVSLPARINIYENGIAVDYKTRRCVVIGIEAVTGTTRCFYSDPEYSVWHEVNISGIQAQSGVFALDPYTGGDGSPIPDSPGYYVDGDGNVIGPDMPIASLCGAPLDQVVRKLHKLGAPQLSDDEFDLEVLEGDIVRGYAIQDAAVTVAEACNPLRRVWTFDLPSYDGQIHAIKRGRDVDWTLPEDDLIAMDSDYEQSMQDDTVSLPRKLHLSYSDLNIDYKETTQISERYSTDVRVVGEEKISMGQLVLSATEAKQAVVKQHKLAWLNAEDTRTLSAPLEYIGAVNSDIVQFRGRRYRIDQMRVEGLQITFESAAYDRASSYQSTAVGTEGVPPPPMGAALRGPTVSVFMNLPVLRDADDKAGIYWAASGLLEGWRGALLQMSRDGTTFENMNIAVPTPCTIGTLQAGILSASRYGLDEVNQIMVKLNPLSPGLDSTDMDGLLREANSAAILYADGTAEIVQFLTAVETAPREYTLSGLLRGRLDTTPGAHNAGASFVLLNDAIRFVPLRNDDVGATITFRAMSAGTVAENNDSVALTLGSFKSLTEWEPAMVRATTGTNEVSVTWAGRGRLGSSRMPVHSLNFDKYRVRVTKSGTTATVETGNQYATVTYTGISEPYTTGVTALSRIDAQFNSPEGTA